MAIELVPTMPQAKTEAYFTTPAVFEILKAATILCDRRLATNSKPS